MKKICIVTPDILGGPVKNCGIGTACYWLAKFYADMPNTQVTIFFTMSLKNLTDADIKKYHHYFLSQHIQFVSLDDAVSDVDERTPNSPDDIHIQKSQKIYEYCRDKNFDIILFQDFQASGFRSFQAKRVGLAFKNTTLALVFHSPAAWLREGSCEWSLDPSAEIRIVYAERYSAQYADILISPSQYMFDWMQQKGWILGEKRYVIPNLINHHLEPGNIHFDTTIDFSHIVFFGRLELRKGLFLFCEAIQKIVNQNHGIKKITFLGKHTIINNESSNVYLTKFSDILLNIGIPVQIIDDCDTFEALEYLKQSGAIAVSPSLLDNYPYTILECLAHKIPFLASRVGGVEEIVLGDMLFETTDKSIQTALLTRQFSIQHMTCLYSGEQTKIKWTDIINNNAAYRQIVADIKTPLVTVCVTHFNHGNYLPSALKSIHNIDYAHVEVIVLDDASTCELSQQVFEEQKIKYQDLGWKFIHNAKNHDVGEARNDAAMFATGEYLIFMDADNIAYSNMIKDYVRGMQISGVDCLTCFFDAFSDEIKISNKKDIIYKYTPIGPCLIMGLVENVFGDSTCCIRRDIFLKIGGFSTDRHKQFEDWEFFARLAISGYKIDVLPACLFMFRYSNSYTSRRILLLDNIKRATRPYLENQSWDIEPLLYDFLIPLYYKSSMNTTMYGQVSQKSKLYQDELKKIKFHLVQSDSKIRELDIKIKNIKKQINIEKQQIEYYTKEQQKLNTEKRIS